eukprot:15455345-Alexandrium_andersonii.AAC.1
MGRAAPPFVGAGCAARCSSSRPSPYAWRWLATSVDARAEAEGVGPPARLLARVDCAGLSDVR